MDDGLLTDYTRHHYDPFMKSSHDRRMRWWMPIGIVLLGLGSIFYLRARETIFIEQITLLIIVLAALGLVLWFIFFTGLRWRTRFLLMSGMVLALIGLILGLRQFTRIDGSIGGSGMPRLAWKWSPPLDAAAGTLQVTTNSSTSAAAEIPGSASFPQFLGPDRSGILPDVRLARDWKASIPQFLWRQPIGAGWSAFAVSGGRAVTQEQRGNDELTVAYDLATGQALWAHTNQVRFTESLGGDGPRATPTIHDGRIYAMGATGILDCLEERTGKLIWTHDVLKENNLKNVKWGKSCSPLILNHLVVVTGGEQREKSLLAFDIMTGKPIWQTGRDCASYCSPMAATLASQEQILIVNGHSVTGHHPNNGRIFWEYPWQSDSPKATQPLLIDTNLVLVAAGYGLGCSLLRIESSSSGEWPVSVVWKNRNIKPKFTNLVRRGAYIYGLDEGVLACLDLTNGNRVWKQGRYGHGQILLVDDVLLIQAESGDVVLVEATPGGHRELARLAALKSKTWNNPVLADNLLLVRNDQEAACYRLALAQDGTATNIRP